VGANKFIISTFIPQTARKARSFSLLPFHKSYVIFSQSNCSVIGIPCLFGRVPANQKTTGSSTIPTSFSGGDHLISSNRTANFKPGSFWKIVANSPYQPEPYLLRDPRELTKHNLQLQSRKPLSYTPMLSKPKPQRLLRATLSMHVEGVGVGEDVFVAVGGLVGGDDA
jgi:hypothetical protein